MIIRFGISDQFSYPVKEFMLKNDALKNGTSCVGLYGSAPPGATNNEDNEGGGIRPPRPKDVKKPSPIGANQPFQLINSKDKK